MKKRVIIIGAGPMGRETYHYVMDAFPEMHVGGFLDDRAHALDGFDGYPSILGSPEGFHIEGGDLFICAIGDPKQRERFTCMMASRGARFVSLIHPKAYIGRNVEVGEGSIVAPFAALTCDISIGKHVLINVQASISHDCVLEDYVTISPGCHITGGCKIGNGSFLGAHSSLVPNVDIAEGVFVGAGAVVVKSVDVPGLRVVGIPAKQM